jgi:hypothetical protein
MKMMKTALLATAAIAAVASSARADELSDLKAQIEALNARVAQVEAAPAVPAGYQLVSITKGEALQFGLDSDEKGPATVISVMPAADAPAGTELSVSGFSRAALVWRNNGWADERLGVRARGEVKIAGKTETAVGEVSAFVKMRANLGANGTGDPGVTSPEFFGNWNFAEGLTLGGGYSGSLAGIGFGYDGKCSCYYTDEANAGFGHGPGDRAQMRLSYSSGPIAFAIGLEDDGTRGGVSNDKALGVAGEMKYSGDMISGEISGGFWNNDAVGPKNAMSIGAGIGFNLGDGFDVSMAAGYFKRHTGEKAWKANVLAKAALSDGIGVELGYNHVSDNRPLGVGDERAIMGGIYFDPVSQLTLGLEAEWISDRAVGAKNKAQVDFVTVYRF